MIDWSEVLRYRKQALVLSALVILVGLLGIGMRGGLLYGIDFTGGLQILLQFDDPISPRELSSVRSLLGQRLEEAQVNTVSMGREGGRRGLMITVRGHHIVNEVTSQLYALGRSESPGFDQLSEGGSLELLGREVLRENFRFGPGDDTQIDLTSASRQSIHNRVQTIVNEELSQQIIELLRQKYTAGSGKIDLNWADVDRIQTWLARQQMRGFVTEILERRQAGTIESIESLRGLLKQFDIPFDSFQSIFTTSPDETDQININDVPEDGLREIVFSEFFEGRYEQQARRIVNARDKQGLFNSVEEVLALPALDGFHKKTLRGTASLSPFVKKSSEMVSPSIGASTVWLAGLAILISLGGILVYLTFRFQVTYSLGAIAAIVHDVLITVGLLTLFGVQFDVKVVSAVLITIGYSLNDTIVNFDRVRENRVLMGYDSDWYKVINRSVYEVLNRTVVTSLTTFLAVMVLYLGGGLALRGLSITLIIGIIAGTYSSIFVASVVLYRLQEAEYFA